MKVSDFEYQLPRELIAQEPLPRRDASRLMLVDPRGGSIEHRTFSELPELLDPGDLLVLNDTRVLPARLFGRKPTGGHVEVVLLERSGGPQSEPRWRCLLHAARSPRPASRLVFDERLSAEVLNHHGDWWELRFEDGEGDPTASLDRLGRMPLPPYIERDRVDSRERLDRERYQTIYARVPGAVAAPTAGLHFTQQILEAIERRGIQRACLTLHVGSGTFQPVRVEQVEDHVLHEEWFRLPRDTAEAIETTRRRGGRVVAVGTTVTRTLEHQADERGRVRPGCGRCSLFIFPGYEFRVVDVLITNFHLPRSTLLMLVSAFAGTETVLAAYREAIRERYRFYSYGDAMMVRSG